MTRLAGRLQGIPEYVTARLDRAIRQARAQGVDVISLGIGDPDVPPAAALRDRLAEEIRRDDAARYPTNRGEEDLRSAVAEHYAERFGVAVDPEREVVPLLGAKEGIAHLALALLDPGDVSLIADPGYPVYASGPRLAGAATAPLPLLRTNGFQPDLAAVPDETARRTRLLVVGYPNNPTGAIARPGLFDELGEFSARHDAIPCHDHAYAELALDGGPAPSALASGAFRERGIEILSLSKTWSIPGWRVAFAVGEPTVIAGLHRLKTQVDAGMFPALQRTAAWALRQPDPAAEARERYRERRDAACTALAAIGLPVDPPAGGMYLWVPLPAGEDAEGFAERVLREAGVAVTPGTAYGDAGEGHVRIALTVPTDRLLEAIGRIGAVL